MILQNLFRTGALLSLTLLSARPLAASTTTDLERFLHAFIEDGSIPCVTAIVHQLG